MAALLRAAPQCVPFQVRLELFRSMLQEDKVRGRWCASRMEGGPPPLQMTIHRDRLLEDAFIALRGKGVGLKARFQVCELTQESRTHKQGLVLNYIVQQNDQPVISVPTWDCFMNAQAKVVFVHHCTGFLCRAATNVTRLAPWLFNLLLSGQCLIDVRCHSSTLKGC